MKLNNEIALTANYTICYWAKTNDVSSNRTFGGSNNSLLKISSTYQYFRANTDGSAFSGTTYGISYNNVPNPKGTNQIQQERWHHYVIRKKTNLIQVYVDGVLQSDSEAVTQTFNLQYIGSADTAYTYQGWMDDILIYARPLGDTEIQNIYDRGVLQHPNPQSMEEI